MPVDFAARKHLKIVIGWQKGKANYVEQKVQVGATCRKQG